MKRLWRIISAVCTAALPLAAQPSPDFLTINNGLSQNYVFDIVQDSRGFIWLGTKEGLNRYDGYTVISHRHDRSDPSSISSNTVTTLFEDRSGILWVGTAGGGVNRFDRGRETFTRFTRSETDAATLSNDHILCISEGSGGALWIGTTSGLNRFDRVTGRVRRYTSSDFPLAMASDNIIDVIETEDTLWISTTKGLGFLSLDGGTEGAVRDGRFPEIAQRGTTALLRDRRGRLLVGARGGLFHWTGRTFEPLFTAVPGNGLFWVSRIREEADGSLLVSTMMRVLRIAPDGTCDTLARMDRERFSRGLVSDRSGVVWCGTSGLGAMILRPRLRQFNQRPGNFLGSLFRDEIGLIDEHCRRRGVPFRVELNFRGSNFASVAEGGGDTLWFLSGETLFLVRRSARSVERFSTADSSGMTRMPNRVYVDRTGDVWLAQAGGVAWFDRAAKRWTYVRLYPGPSGNGTMENSSSYADITALFRDRAGRLWCGTPELGLLRYDPADGSVRRFAPETSDGRSLSSAHVLFIAEDPFEPDSILWIGTDGGGLCRMNIAAGLFTPYTTREGFPNNVVYSILTAEDGRLWMSTNNGLVRFDPAARTWEVFDQQDGLQSNEFNRNEYWRTRDGRMFFGGIYGYNEFRPSAIVRNGVPPLVAVTGFQLFNIPVRPGDSTGVLRQTVNETDSIALRYEQNVFSFQFSALDYHTPRKNRYAYMLEGFNQGWIEAGMQRTATYTNLDPGRYVFRVKASNGDGVWNDDGRSVVLTVLPPFWMTWWFRGILALVFLSAGPAVYFVRVRQLKREQRRQQEVSRLLIESQESERKRIAQEMHDSLGQELLVIKNRALMGLKSAGDGTKERRQLEQISDGATGVLEKVRSLSHILRPPELDRLGLTETVRSILENVRDASAFALQAEVGDIDGALRTEDEINLVRILQELLSNIAKHAGANAVRVTIGRTDAVLTVEVSDDGRGFDPDTERNGIGLAGMSERVRILQGTMTVTSAAGRGTQVSILIPLRGMHG